MAKVVPVDQAVSSLQSLELRRGNLEMKIKFLEQNLKENRDSLYAMGAEVDAATIVLLRAIKESVQEKTND